MTKEFFKNVRTDKIGTGAISVTAINNPFEVTDEVVQLLSEVNDTNRDQYKNRIINLLLEQHGRDYIQFLSDKGNLLQISVADWTEHLITRTGEEEPWYFPKGATVCHKHDPELFVQVAEGKYVHRNLEAEKIGHVDYGIGDMPGQSGPTGKEFTAEAELFINGERYDQTIPNAATDSDDERLWQRVRQGVIDDLIREWGGPTVEALDNHGRSIMLTAEEVADTAMKQHYLRGMQELNQPFSRQPKGRDVETIYGSRARDMRGSVRVNDVSVAVNRGVVTLDEFANGKTYEIKYETKEGPLGADAGMGLSRAWRPENILPKRSKTVHKPVRKVTLREKARAQRRARRKSR